MDLYLDTEGARLRYRDEGRGSPVIFVHGWTLDLEQWDFQAAALLSDFRIIRYDRRGYGLSTGSPSTNADCADLLTLYEHLDLGPAGLLGMSQGARVALQFATFHPERVSSLILDGPPYLGPMNLATANDVPYQHYRGLAQTLGIAAFRREWREHPLVRLINPDPRANELLTRILARYPGRDLTEPAAFAGDPVEFDLASFDKPTLVFNGKFDSDSRKRFARHLMSQIPGAEYVEIPEAGHLSNLDNSPVYTDHLREFLKRHAVSPPGQSLRSST